jgi:hypothetical protein
MKTANKIQIADLLRSVADLIEVSTNKTITINLELKFNVDKK